MVDVTRDDQGRVHARLLDLAPGRAKKAVAIWPGLGRSRYRQ